MKVIISINKRNDKFLYDIIIETDINCHRIIKSDGSLYKTFQGLKRSVSSKISKYVPSNTPIEYKGGGIKHS
jgi:hypothetical protein